jgi:hypothetical protein
MQAPRDERQESAGRWLPLVAVAVFVAAIAAAFLPGAEGRSQQVSLPEIGVTFTHSSIPPSCDLYGGLVATYDERGVRAMARAQLAAMRAAGIDAIRILLWNQTDATPNPWGVVSSAGGSLREPYRSNLVNYVRDVRDAGFKSLIVEYSPQWENSPIGSYDAPGNWNPAKFEENWGFISDTRQLVKRAAGKMETWFDPLSEGAPSSYQPPSIVARLESYIAEMYRRYDAAFGRSDLIFTVIGKGPDPDGTIDRFEHLFNALNSTGLGMPPRFGVHADWTSPADLVGIRAADQALTVAGIDAPLVIGESVGEGPNSRAVADDIARFTSSTDRRIAEIYLWFQRGEGDRCLTPPYRADSYIQAFSGSPPSSTLFASVRGQIVDFHTPYGQSVSALTAGHYRLRVADGSARANFHLVGPKVDKRTGIRATSSPSWVVTLLPGVYRFGSDSSPASKRKTVTVFAAS